MRRIALLLLLALPAAAQDPREITVEKIDSTYPAAEGKTSGFFRTGQPADLALSSMGFNEAGGPLLFNHPAGIATDGTRLFLADTYNNRVLIWSKLPAGNEPPDLVLGQKDFHGNASGDGRDRMNFPITCASDGTRLLVADTNNDRILIWNEAPKSNGAPADLVLGGGGPARGLQHDRVMWPWGVWSDGTRVAVSSTRAGSVLVWIPDASAAHPDLVYRLDGGPMGIGLHGDTLALAGRTTVLVWDKLPLDGNLPDRRFDRGIGSVEFQELRGVAVDDRYFYLSDGRAGRVYVWKGVPSGDEAPFCELEVENPWRVTSDGQWLVVGTGDKQVVHVWEVASLGPAARSRRVTGPGAGQRFNWVQTAFASCRHLFVAECGMHRVHCWERVEDALAGKAPDAVLGQAGLAGITAATARDRLFNPATAWFDGTWLWVGETKFSERLLRFSPGK